MKRAVQWARRHKEIVSASAVVLVLALAGLIAVALLDARREEQRRRQAEANYVRARDVVERTLATVSDGLAFEPELTRTQSILLQEALGFYERFLADSGTESEQQRELALAHDGAGWILTVLGRHEEAERHLSNALARLGALARERAEDLALTLDLARVQGHLGELWLARGDADRTERAFREAARLAGAVAARAPTAAHLLEQARRLMVLGRFLVVEDRPGEASEFFRRARDILAELDAGAGSEPEHRGQLALAYSRLGGLLPGEDSLEARLRALAIWQGLASEFPDDPDYHREVWQAEWKSRQAIWKSRVGFETGDVNPAAADDLRIKLADLERVPEDDRPLTTLPVPFRANLMLFGLAAKDDEGRVAEFLLEGSASHGGPCTGRSRVSTFMTADGPATQSTTRLDFGHGDSFELWTFGISERNRVRQPWLTVSYVILNGTGRFAGVTGEGTGKLFNQKVVLVDGVPDFSGGTVRAELSGSIHRESR